MKPIGSFRFKASTRKKFLNRTKWNKNYYENFTKVVQTEYENCNVAYFQSSFGEEHSFEELKTNCKKVY